jgi:hypothetical protein
MDDSYVNYRLLRRLRNKSRSLEQEEEEEGRGGGYLV